MAIDSQLKRRSIAGLSWPAVLPNPLGTIGAGSRAMLAWTYAFGNFSPPPVVTFVIRARRRRYHSYSRWSNRVPS